MGGIRRGCAIAVMAAAIVGPLTMTTVATANEKDKPKDATSCATTLADGSAIIAGAPFFAARSISGSLLATVGLPVIIDSYGPMGVDLYQYSFGTAYHIMDQPGLTYLNQWTGLVTDFPASGQWVLPQALVESKDFLKCVRKQLVEVPNPIVPPPPT